MASMECILCWCKCRGSLSIYLYFNAEHWVQGLSVKTEKTYRSKLRVESQGKIVSLSLYIWEGSTVNRTDIYIKCLLASFFQLASRLCFFLMKWRIHNFIYTLLITYCFTGIEFIQPNFVILSSSSLEYTSASNSKTSQWKVFVVGSFEAYSCP